MTRVAPPAHADRATAILTLACAAQFMVVLDVAVVNVALVSIQDDLGFGPVNLQWVASGYALAFAGLLLLGGRLADVYGHRRAMVSGLTLFTAASLAGGLAATPAMLIAARVGQGVGAAVLAPATLTVLTTSFPEGRRRTRALAIWTAVSLAGGAAGNLVGGLLTHALSWRATLLINLPIGMLAIGFAVRTLAGPPRAGTRGGLARLDPAGAVLATAGLLSVTFGVTRAQTGGWADPVTMATVPAGLLLLAAFVVAQARRPADALLPPRLLRIRGVAVGNLATLLVAAGFQVSMWYFLTLYLQDVLDYSPLQAGAGFLPHTVLMLSVGLYVTPRLMRLVPARTLVAGGALLAAAGFLWQSRLSADGDYVSAVLGPAIVMSAGGGLLNTPLTATVIAGVPTDVAGAASGLLNTTKQFGGALGLAVLLAVAGPGGGTPDELVSGYRTAFAGIAAILVLAAGLTVLLPARRDS